MVLLKKKTSIPVIAAVILVALATSGYSYAHWTEWMYLDGYVETGYMCAEIVTWFGNDPPGSIDPGYTKDIATTYAWIDSVDPRYAYVQIVDAYPSYEVRFTCDIHNCGTIPWNMTTPTVNGVTLIDSEWVDFDLDEDGDFDVNIMYIDGENKQVHPCQIVEWSLRIHVKQGADACGELYYFLLEVEVVQWNAVLD